MSRKVFESGILTSLSSLGKFLNIKRLSHSFETQINHSFVLLQNYRSSLFLFVTLERNIVIAKRRLHIPITLISAIISAADSDLIILSCHLVTYSPQKYIEAIKKHCIHMFDLKGHLSVPFKCFTV